MFCLQEFVFFCVFIYIFDLQVVAAMAGEGVGAGSGSICFRKVKGEGKFCFFFI